MSEQDGHFLGEGQWLGHWQSPSILEITLPCREIGQQHWPWYVYNANSTVIGRADAVCKLGMSMYKSDVTGLTSLTGLTWWSLYPCILRI